MYICIVMQAEARLPAYIKYVCIARYIAKVVAEQEKKERKPRTATSYPNSTNTN